MSDLCQSSASSCFFHVSTGVAITAILFIAAPIMARWCDRLVADSNAKTFYTKEASPVDHPGRVLWSWTADQLRQRCATEFYRLDDGTMSTRFFIERGADEAETPANCIAALS